MTDFRKHVLDILDRRNGTQSVNYREADAAIIEAIDKHVMPRIKALEEWRHTQETKGQQE